MQVEGWMITIFVIILTWLGSLVAFRVSTKKDIDSLYEKSREQKIVINCMNDELKNNISEEYCRERRAEFNQGLSDIKDAVIRLDQKFDKYILNNGG